MSRTEASLGTVGHRFVEAFNRRDANALIALTDPEVEFSPTSLVSTRRTYRGHDGMRRWVSELRQSAIEHQVRVREVRVLDAARIVVLSEVLLGGESISPSAMLARLSPDGLIVEAHAYLTDEPMLIQLGLLAEPVSRA
jgi:hypothetical protein